MIPEEQLNRLTERMDALAQTVQVLAEMQIRTEENLQKVIEAQKVSEQRFQGFIDRMDRAMGQVAMVLQSHERRLGALEGDSL